MAAELLKEARRQAEICNACRYCESFCAVFPALHDQRSFSDGDLTQFANLCHNCRSCYYACQYTSPHEFNLNLPKALAELRQESWERFAWPGPFAKAFQKSGVAIASAIIATFIAFMALIQLLPAVEGEGFYAVLSHNAMISIFLPAFFLPAIAMTIALRRYWHEVSGQKLKLDHWRGALKAAATMKNLQGGHGEGCNFEDEDRYSQARRHTHQAMLWGFLLCFASTSIATLMHYGLNWPAPYPWYTPPKLLGIPGGLLLAAGAIATAMIKRKADPNLGAKQAWNGEMAFIHLLSLTAITGLALYILGQTTLMPALLAFHLATVLTVFLLTPYSKMAHGFFRMAALLRSEQQS